ncbi:hypothetical protein FN846DRAFT_964179 [Sphaerosporella brunnea]|uniref:Ubiquitin thioesterase OTU n=1 Tax=Sphaerosporella brunnea TaxID=1250544 RepID=A0A5J5ELR4_9PEZI|nr:hypothetical protein FN846DRAFT_964179 [Sphaerosporella brunnea]
MRLKIRSPTGTQVLTLPEGATIDTLLSEIRKTASLIGELEIKHGFPPRPLQLSAHPADTPLAQLPVKLQGEQLIVSSAQGVGASPNNSTPASAPVTRSQTATKLAVGDFSGFTAGGSAALNRPQQPLRLNRAASKFNKDDPPDVRLASGRGRVVLRVMEDDNSCLFRALSYVLTRSVMSVEELRQLVAGTIQDNPVLYSEAVLEQKRDGYCEWIKMESSWGGGIELGIFAEFFDMEIVTIDVATGNMIRFNEGKERRVIVVYSGIHYDALALSPGGLVNDSEGDEVVFSKYDNEILAAAQQLCGKLRQKHYYTDTKNFTLRCNICKQCMKGEKEAVAHATATGHSDFGEA